MRCERLTTKTARTLPAVLGYGTLFSVVLSAFEYTGGSLWGHKKDSDVDEFERKEKLRKNKRRPIQETIDELGEGRGISTHWLCKSILTWLQVYMAPVMQSGEERLLSKTTVLISVPRKIKHLQNRPLGDPTFRSTLRELHVLYYTIALSKINEWSSKTCCIREG